HFAQGDFTCFGKSSQSALSWGFADVISAEETTLKLMLDNPMFGTASGLLKNSATKSMWLVVTKLDMGESPQADIVVELFGPDRISPGQTITYTIEVKNNGLASANDISLIAKTPERSQFICASGNYIYNELAHWVTNSEYYNVSVLRWDFTELPAKTTTKITMTVKLNWGISWGANMQVETFAMPKSNADEIFPLPYPDYGTDDD
ncbi:MAG TPA: hypothetical protein DEE98_00685, partial [Elusimicrobia bacterium]|nr:hypothetical protein [Elusimicrobiota bacterium]